jgi:hypothetical protein
LGKSGLSKHESQLPGTLSKLDLNPGKAKASKSDGEEDDGLEFTDAIPGFSLKTLLQPRKLLDKDRAFDAIKPGEDPRLQTSSPRKKLE